MKRLALNLPVLLSIALTATVAMMWLRSYWSDDRIAQWNWNGTDYELWSHRGGLTLGNDRAWDEELRRAAGDQLLRSKLQVQFTLIRNKYLLPPRPSATCMDLPTVEETSNQFKKRVEETPLIIMEHFLPTASAAPTRTKISHSLPHTFVLTLVGIPLWIGMAKQAVVTRRRKKRICVQCCYDLRASSERCPECGTPI